MIRSRRLFNYINNISNPDFDYENPDMLPDTDIHYIFNLPVVFTYNGGTDVQYISDQASIFTHLNKEDAENWTPKGVIILPQGFRNENERDVTGTGYVRDFDADHYDPRGDKRNIGSYTVISLTSMDIYNPKVGATDINDIPDIQFSNDYYYPSLVKGNLKPSLYQSLYVGLGNNSPFINDANLPVQFKVANGNATFKNKVQYSIKPLFTNNTYNTGNRNEDFLKQDSHSGIDPLLMNALKDINEGMLNTYSYLTNGGEKQIWASTSDRNNIEQIVESCRDTFPGAYACAMYCGSGTQNSLVYRTSFYYGTDDYIRTQPYVWYLPSITEAAFIGARLNDINATLRKISNIYPDIPYIPIKNSVLMSSTLNGEMYKPNQYSDEGAMYVYGVDLENGYINRYPFYNGSASGSNKSMQVRAVLRGIFNDPEYNADNPEDNYCVNIFK